jgi:hypothetical protein
MSPEESTPPNAASPFRPGSNQAGIVWVGGVRGMGKSTLVRHLASKAPRMLAHDPHGEHDGLPLSDHEAAEYLEGLAARSQLDRFRVCVTVTEPERFARLAWALRELCPDYLLLVDEVDLVAPPMREPWAFRRIVAQGRHHGISVLAASRRPAEVSRLVTSQAREFYCFFTREPGDVRYLASIFGEDADALDSLAPFEFLYWSPTRSARGHVSPQGITWQKAAPRDRIVSPSVAAPGAGGGGRPESETIVPSRPPSATPPETE